DHFTATPDCRVKVSASRRIGDAGDRPTVGAGVVSPAAVKSVSAVITAPDDHLASCPDRGESISASRGVGQAGGLPAIRAWVVSASGVDPLESAPDDHFAAG